jgi:predicted nucleic acid-binding protein
MNFLLDSNVISEWTKPHPHAGLVAWLANVDEDRVRISVITLAELRHGIERMPPGARRSRLDTWLTEQVALRFDARILPVDAETAETEAGNGTRTGARPAG